MMGKCEGGQGAGRLEWWKLEGQRVTEKGKQR